MKYRIVLVPFPFDNLSSSKVRPALSLSDEIGPHQHLILAFITSRIPANILDTDLVLNTTDADFAMTGLKLTSTIRLHRLMTVSAQIIQFELGDLVQTHQSIVESKLRELFNL